MLEEAAKFTSGDDQIHKIFAGTPDELEGVVKTAGFEYITLDYLNDIQSGQPPIPVAIIITAALRSYVLDVSSKNACMGPLEKLTKLLTQKTIYISQDEGLIEHALGLFGILRSDCTFRQIMSVIPNLPPVLGFTLDETLLPDSLLTAYFSSEEVMQNYQIAPMLDPVEEIGESSVDSSEPIKTFKDLLKACGHKLSRLCLSTWRMHKSVAIVSTMKTQTAPAEKLVHRAPKKAPAAPREKAPEKHSEKAQIVILDTSIAKRPPSPAASKDKPQGREKRNQISVEINIPNDGERSSKTRGRDCAQQHDRQKMTQKTASAHDRKAPSVRYRIRMQTPKDMGLAEVIYELRTYDCILTRNEGDHFLFGFSDPNLGRAAFAKLEEDFEDCSPTVV